MNIHVRHYASHHRNLALTRQVETRMRTALDRFEPTVVRVRVLLGCTGRAEHWCRVQAELIPDLHLVVFASEQEVLDAVDRAADKLVAVVTRSRGRRCSIARSRWRQSSAWA